MDEKLNLVFKALAHTERRRILTSLRLRPNQSLFEICVSATSGDGAGLTRQTVSQHLSTLERAGLLEIAWVGRTKTHAVRLEPLRRAIDFLGDTYLYEEAS